MKINLAIITTHPIQYQVPLFKELSKSNKFTPYIFFATDLGVNKEKINKDFNLKFSWNIKMLSGYKFFFSKNNIWNNWKVKRNGSRISNFSLLLVTGMEGMHSRSIKICFMFSLIQASHLCSISLEKRIKIPSYMGISNEI